VENRLRELRNRLNISAEEMANALGVSPGYYYKLERGEKRLNVDHLNKLASFKNISADYILNFDDREEIFPEYLHIQEIDGHNITMLPIIGDISAGIPITAIPEKGEYMPLDASVCSINGHRLEEYFYFRIKGDSMEPTILDKDIVLVRRQPIVENGQVAIVLCDELENATCKRVTMAADKLILNSDNRNYAPMIHDANKCMIIGKVIGRYGVIK
jgi:repressor LexA